MNPPCSSFKMADFQVHHCSKYMDHTGSHWDSRTGLTWPQAQRVAYVSGRGHGKVAYQDWFTKEWEVTDARYKAKVTGEFPDDPEEISVLLTLEDLKVIAYYLPSDGNDDDAPTVAKIEEALKEML